jgi:hypothetical protein
MAFEGAVDAATKAGMALSPKEEDFLETPPDTRAWQGTEHANFKGMDAARAAGGSASKYVDMRCITKAASLAQSALHALVLFVLHAPIKVLGVSGQIEWGNAMRTFALLSEASLLRNIVCVTLCRGVYVPCEALHRLLHFLYEQMKIVKPRISRGAAVHMALSVALLFANEIFAGDDVALSVIGSVQNVLGVQALCSYAAQNTSFHSGQVRARVRSSTSRVDAHANRRDRLDGVVRDE